MTQLRDAYIVAATRTPIGKSGRGVFKNTRPDDLLVAVIKNALAQVPTLDPAAIEDAIDDYESFLSPIGADLGRMSDGAELDEKYVAFLHRSAPAGLDGLKIVIDGGMSQL